MVMVVIMKCSSIMKSSSIDGTGRVCARVPFGTLTLWGGCDGPRALVLQGYCVYVLCLTDPRRGGAGRSSGNWEHLASVPGYLARLPSPRGLLAFVNHSSSSGGLLPRSRRSSSRHAAFFLSYCLFVSH